jgi:RNA polymerase sigma factor (sigma-70 family)
MRREDARAIEEFLLRHRPFLLHLARRAAPPPHLGDDEREDLVMELLERTAARLARWDSRIPPSLGAYLATALRYRLANARRDRERRLRAHREAASEEAGQEEGVVLSTCSEGTLRASRGPGWESDALSPALRRLQAALAATLAEEERTLLLWERNRIPKRLIAEWLGAGYEATRQRIRRLRARLRAAALRHAATLAGAERREVLRYIQADEADVPPPPAAAEEPRP